MEHESDTFGGYGPASSRLRLFFFLASIERTDRMLMLGGYG
jgi:hypothetical protein